MKYFGKIQDNKDLVTKEYVDTGLSGKQDTLTFDTTPTANSTNPVTSGGIKSALTQVAENMADAYDSTATYAVGALCIHDDALYKCNTAIGAGGEAWTAAHWTATTVADEINNAVVPTLKRIFVSSSTQNSETLAKNYFLSMNVGMQYVLTYATDRTATWLMLKIFDGAGVMIRFYYDGNPGTGNVSYYNYDGSWHGPTSFTMS